MLIEFSVENHRSIADEQTLSLVASNLTEENSNAVLQVGGESGTKVLSTAILLGKNGSGKSSLIDAIRFLRRFVASSSSSKQEGDEIPFSPNKICKNFERNPTAIRILFSVGLTFYQYEFSFDNKKIYHEKLSKSEKTVRFKKVFDRIYSKTRDCYKYSYGEDFRGKKSVWESSTRNNALYLSTAIQLNSKSLKEPFEWLTKFFIAVDAGKIGHQYTATQCTNYENKNNVINLLKCLDIEIEDIIIEEKDIDIEALEEVINQSLLKKMLADGGVKKQVEINFLHRKKDGSNAKISFENQSTGTKAIFSLAGPIFDALSNGYCLIIDEINTSLHPLILHTLVDAFCDPQVNTKRAQLIFTSHDTSLLRDKFFRRDQVWFVEREQCQGTELIPLSDFSPRKSEALEKGYLAGRYRGVPYISKLGTLLKGNDGVQWNEIETS